MVEFGLKLRQPSLKFVLNAFKEENDRDERTSNGRYFRLRKTHNLGIVIVNNRNNFQPTARKCLRKRLIILCSGCFLKNTRTDRIGENFSSPSIK